MSSLKVSIPHHLSQDEAVQRIKSLLGSLQQEQKDRIKNVKEEWSGNKAEFSFTVQGFDLSGNINVTGNEVSLDADLPFALSFFKGKISQVIEDKVKDLLK